MSKKAAAAEESAKGAGMGAQEAIHKNKESPTAARFATLFGTKEQLQERACKK